jgi:chromosome partitioning protein
MRTIAITNQKGGSGKTTTTVNLAAALAEQGKKTLVVDLDPQGSASKWLAPTGKAETPLYDVLTEGEPLAEAVANTAYDGIDLIPATPSMTRLEKALANEVGAETIFRTELGKLEGDWDYVLLDCPPSLGLLALSALTAADEVLVPVEASVLALQGLASLTKTIQRVRDRLNPSLELGGIVVCRARNTNLSKEVLGLLQDRFGDSVYDARVRNNVRLAEAPSFGEPITVYDTRSIGADDYRAVATEFLGRQAN